MELVSGDALFAGRHQMETENPLGQRDVAGLHDRAVGHREMALAGVALMEAGAMRLAMQPSDAVH